MAPSPTPAKRRAGNEPTSPPVAKKRIQSGTTKPALSSFFTPTSQKPKDRTAWSERAPNDDTVETLLVGRYDNGVADSTALPRRKIAAFDLDGTLITPASGKKHSDSATDWKWWNGCVPAKLKSLYDDGYRVVIISNQGGIKLRPDPNSKAPRAMLTKRLENFKQKCGAVLTQLDIPTAVYAATGHDAYRKPRTGIWKEICEDFDLDEGGRADLGASFFVGDAGGRSAEGTGAKAVAKDFSCSDRNFSHNLGIRFQTPEEFFLGEKPRRFKRDFDIATYPFSAKDSAGNALFKKTDGKEIVVFCGPPGAGKSTFYWKHLKPLGYERINQDTLKSRDKCLQAARSSLEEGDSVAIDNTNADPEARAVWVGLAKKFNVPIRCVWFKTPIYVCEHNDAVRSMNAKLNPEMREVLPRIAFNGFAARYKEPTLKEGFKEIITVEFQFRGTADEYEVWAKYWT